MPTYVGLLRGINVGGRNVLPMADLRHALEDGGATDVVTYIQSGNVVFDHAAGDVRGLTTELEARVRAAAGFDVPLIVRTAAEWKTVEDSNPFRVGDRTKLHVRFFADPVPEDAYAAIDLDEFAPDRLVVSGREVYFFLPNGVGRSRLVALRPARGAPDGTMRNWNTVVKLRELATR